MRLACGLFLFATLSRAQLYVGSTAGRFDVYADAVIAPGSLIYVYPDTQSMALSPIDVTKNASITNQSGNIELEAQVLEISPVAVTAAVVPSAIPLGFAKLSFSFSAFPYQPKGLWEETAYGDVFSAQSYTPGSGADLYRRSMYSFWNRTSPPPSLNTFDAPDREECTARRARTNTPLQALVLLNDPTYVEASRALAERMLTETGRDPPARINFAFRLATARKPTSKERQLLRDIAEREAAVYHKDPDAARKLLHVGESKVNAKLDARELAAWTTVASVILNLDETITKE